MIALFIGTFLYQHFHEPNQIMRNSISHFVYFDQPHGNNVVSMPPNAFNTEDGGALKK